MDPRIQLTDIRFQYTPERIVFDDLDFALNPDERVVLTGSNGAGKTTLLHIIMGLAKPTRGRVSIFGETREDEADFLEVRRRVGLLFQDADVQLFSPTVFEDVAFGPLNLGQGHDQTRDVVLRTLELVGLSGYEDRITYQLSYGEKRLVGLATILAMEPEVLLLDEPTAGLDEEHETRLISILQQRTEDMIIVSHNRSFIDAVATRVLALEHGRLHDAAI